jgi:predicted RNA-binding protein associated with RNAse of E/G family
VDRQTVTEVKTRVDGTTAEYRCERLALEPGTRAVLRYVLEADRTVGDVALPRGTVTIAHYWSDRPYNVYHWVDGTRTLGLYFSVCTDTHIEEGRVSYQDLAIDVLLKPSGAIDILDEDEVPVDLEPRKRRAIADALEALVTNPKRLAAEIERETRNYL